VSESPGSLRGYTVHIVRLTPFCFDLNGRVVDVKPMFDIARPAARLSLFCWDVPEEWHSAERSLGTLNAFKPEPAY
jgi:hypothetical protein